MRDGSAAATGTARHRLVRDPDRTGGWTLWVGGTPQSHVDLDDPTYLEFEYVRWIGHVIDTFAEAGHPLAVLHLGGGALTLPRYVAATRPGSCQRVVEIDEELTRLVRERLPLPARSGVRVRHGDARAALAGMRPGQADLLISDVFDDGIVPSRFTSAEFAADASRVLRAQGCLVLNVADGPGLRFSRSLAVTLLAAFERVALVAAPGVLRGRRFGNVVMLSSRGTLPLTGLQRRCAGDSTRARVVSGTELQHFVAGAAAITDATATGSPPPPADWLR